MNIQRVTWLQSAARGRAAVSARAVCSATGLRPLLRAQVLLW